MARSPDPRASEATAARQRKIQSRIDRKKPAAKASKSSERAMQAGARRYPELPFPKQHLRKPGRESVLDPAPMFDAPFYKGSGKREG